MLAYVRFGPGVAGIGSVLIDTQAVGARFGKPSRFMSQEKWVQSYFENVLVPADMVVLKEGGCKKQIAGFNVERIGNSACSLALGRYSFEAARRCRGRMIAGGSIEILKNRIAESVFERSFSQRPDKE